MPEMQNKNIDIKVRLTILDYFGYYFSLMNRNLSGKIINLLSGVVILIYFISLISLIYGAISTGIFDQPTAKGITIDLVVMMLFSTPFMRIYLVSYKDAKTHKYLDNDINIRITKDKLIVSPEGAKHEYPWNNIKNIFEFSLGFALFIDKRDQAFVLPKRCFKNKEQIRFLKEIILKNKK